MGSLNDICKPNDVLGVDIIGFINGIYVLVKVDFLSRYVMLDTCRVADGESVVRSLRRWVRECGPIRKLVTNQGEHFTNRLVEEWCQRGNVDHVFTHVYDHRTNGLVERCNGSVLEVIGKIQWDFPHRNWWRNMTQAERIVNGRYHRALGMTSFEVLHGGA